MYFIVSLFILLDIQYEHSKVSPQLLYRYNSCLLYTSDAADEL